MPCFHRTTTTAPFNLPLQPKKLLQRAHRILRARNRMSRRPAILIDLTVVAAFGRLVAEEMDGRVVDPREGLLRREMLQAVCLVPAGGEDVEGDLAADRIAVRVSVSVGSRSKSPGRRGWEWGMGSHERARMGERAETHVRPRSGNRALSASMNLTRIPCSVSNF